MTTFKAKLVSLRTQRGFSRSQAAEHLGISEQAYIDYECGPISPSVVERMGLFVALSDNLETGRQLALESDGGSFEEILAEISEVRVPFVRIEAELIEVIGRGRSGVVYRIGLDRINSPLMVMRWIEHLSEKTWVTKQHLREFVEVCSEHLGVSLHPV